MRAYARGEHLSPKDRFLSQGKRTGKLKKENEKLNSLNELGGISRRKVKARKDAETEEEIETRGKSKNWMKSVMHFLQCLACSFPL